MEREDLVQGTHSTGKKSKMAKIIPVRENTGILEMLSKHMEFFCLSYKFPVF